MIWRVLGLLSFSFGLIVSGQDARAARWPDPVCFLHKIDSKKTQVVIYDLKTKMTTVMAEGRLSESAQALTDLVASKHCRNGSGTR